MRTILVAPSGFKECLGPREVADAIADGIARADPTACILRVPLIDGGEGFVDELVRLAGGVIEPVVVEGPVGIPVTARLGLIDAMAHPSEGPARTAVLEIADAAGLRQVPAALRDPTRTGSRGVGQLLVAALDRGVRRILVGCGDSGVNDGGLGMARALGWRFADGVGRPIESAGALASLASIDGRGRDRRLDGVRIDVVVNPFNDLLGPGGVSYRYGPQKGATPAQVARLDAGLTRLAEQVRATVGCDLAAMAGAGASGGLGGGLAAFAGARLLSRFVFARGHLAIDAALEQADLVITAEGCVDAQTAIGKMPSWVARRARRRGVPVVALAGRIVLPLPDRDRGGFDALIGIAQRPCGDDEAIAQAGHWLRDAAANVVGLMRIGQKEARPGRHRPGRANQRRETRETRAQDGDRAARALPSPRLS